MKLLLLSCLVILFPVESHAYLDPASGGAILQVIVGVLASTFLTLKFYWGSLKGFFRDKFRK